MKNQRDKLSLPTTNSMPGPGDFPLGSIESRAVARARVQRSIEGRERTTFLLLGFGLKAMSVKKADIGQWDQQSDGSFTRQVTGPSEMSSEDALEIFGTSVNPGKIGFFGIHQ
jgi:hypothetical protein